MAKPFTSREKLSPFEGVRDWLWNYPYALIYLYSRIKRLRIISVVVLVAIITIFAFHFIYSSILAGKGMNSSTLAIGIADTNQTYNPLGQNHLSKTINTLVFNDLFYLDGNDNPTPELAESWSVNSNNTSITMFLKKNVLWQDGREFNADDVIYSYKLVKELNPHGAMSRITIEKIDNYTILITVQGLDLNIWQDLHWPIFPAHSVYSTNQEIGTGPYIFQKSVNGQYQFIANSKYAFGKPLIKYLTVSVFSNQHDLLQAYLDGEINTASLFDPDKTTASSLLNIKMDHLISQPLNTNFSALFFNTDKLSNTKIRQGLSYAISQKELEIMLGGYISLMDGPINSSSWAYSNSNQISRYQYSTAEALTMFESAGYTEKDGKLIDKDGHQFVISISYNLLSANLSVLEVVKSDLNNIGIQVNLIPLTSSDWNRDVINGKDFQTAFVQVEGNIDPDPSGIWSSDGAENLAGYKNKAVDEYLDLAKNVADQSKRKNVYVLFQKTLMEDAPAAFLYNPNVIVIAKPNISLSIPSSIGFEEDVLNKVQYWRI